MECTHCDPQSPQEVLHTQPKNKRRFHAICITVLQHKDQFNASSHLESFLHICLMKKPSLTWPSRCHFRPSCVQTCIEQPKQTCSTDSLKIKQNPSTKTDKKSKHWMQKEVLICVSVDPVPGSYPRTSVPLVVVSLSQPKAMPWISLLCLTSSKEQLKVSLL